MKKTISAVCAVLLLCAACARAETVSVRAARAGDTGYGEQRSYFGSVQGSRRVNLSFRVPGPLVELPADVGTRVKKGDLIARIDPRDFRTRLADAQSQLSQAKARYEQAQSNFRRYEELYKKKVVPQAQYESFRTAFDVARSSLRTAEAGVSAARNSLADTELRAPFGGVIVARMAENFQDVQPMQAIVSVQDLDTVEIVVPVPEDDVANLSADGTRSISAAKAAGLDLKVTFDALPGRVCKAAFREIATQSDPRTRTYAATVAMPQPSEARILPGMSAQVSVALPALGGERPSGLLVPLEAIVGDVSGHIWVWKLTLPDRAVRVPVTAGEFRGACVVVSGDLTPDDRIVVEGARNLADDSVVRVLP